MEFFYVGFFFLLKHNQSFYERVSIHVANLFNTTVAGHDLCPYCYLKIIVMLCIVRTKSAVFLVLFDVIIILSFFFC